VESRFTKVIIVVVFFLYLAGSVKTGGHVLGIEFGKGIATMSKEVADIGDE
jgi:hypothetical protein